MSLTKAQIAELDELHKECEGEDLVDAVVEKAKDPKSALHSWSRWDWDRGTAAEQWWKVQARQLVGVYFSIVKVPSGEEIKIPHFVSVKTEEGRRDRIHLEVLAENRNVLINRVCDLIYAHLEKAKHLHELNPIRDAVLRVRLAATTPPPRRRGRPRKGGRPEARA